MAYKSQLHARMEARKEYGVSAVENVDFTISDIGDGWTYAKMEPQTDAATVAQEKRLDPLQGIEPIEVPTEGTKNEALYALMRAPGGISQHGLEKATGWPAGTVRGWIGKHRKHGMPKGWRITTSKEKVKGARVFYHLVEIETEEPI